MEPSPHNPDPNRVTPITRGSRRSRITKEIAANKAKRRRLDIDLEKLAAALQANDHAEAIKRGRLNFVAAVEKLDLVVREMLVNTVLEIMADGTEKVRVQTWFANLSAQPSFGKKHVLRGEPKTSSEAETKATSSTVDD